MIKSKVVLIPFPFDDLSSHKVRPAICLTNPIGKHRHILLAFITSRISNNPLYTDIVIYNNHKDFIKTGLKVSSMVQLHRITTITTSIIRRELGYFSTTLMKEIYYKLNKLFEI